MVTRARDVLGRLWMAVFSDWATKNVYLHWPNQYKKDMEGFFLPPHPALAPYIEGFRYVDIGANGNLIDLHPVGFNALAFILNTEQVFEALDFKYNFRLSHNGHICKHITFKALAPSIKAVVVPFTPTGAFKLFGVCQQELTNKLLPLDDIIRGAIDVNNRLEDMVPTAREAIAVIQHWLLKKIPRSERNYYVARIDYACKLIKSHKGQLRIKDLCREVGMSQTYLQNHFNEMVGMSAKLYGRMERFMGAYQFICQHAQVRWADLIHDYNYFDQSHFIREFKMFFGSSPSRVHMANPIGLHIG